MIETTITTEAAIKCFERMCVNGDATEADRTALEALREKQQRDNQQPLTLEELKERIGKPVLLVHKAGGRHWEILEEIKEITKKGTSEIRIFYRGCSVLGCGYYPKCTKHYDHEPKEEGER